ncbi:hypothetical protein F5Y16DRAFT_118604 [Xylariaceae sp. FL0255]|nr:hypothetical protein F5Y16DRAFT_118604 [Xylariaceae sp. FL0255]
MAQQNTTDWVSGEPGDDGGGYVEHMDHHPVMYNQYQTYGYPGLNPYGHGHYAVQNPNPYTNMDFQIDPQAELYAAQYQPGLMPGYDAPQYTGAYQNIPSAEDRQGYMSHVSPHVSPPPAPVLAHNPPAMIQHHSPAPIGMTAPKVVPAPVVAPEQVGNHQHIQATQKIAVSKDAAATFIHRPGKPGNNWLPVKGCPNLFIGKTAVPRQDLPKTVKKNIAGDNRNGTRLLPLLPDLLPCEVLRNQLRPLTNELEIVKGKIKSLTKSGEVQAGELEQLQKRRDDLEKQIKAITDHGAASKSKKQTTSKSDLSDAESDSSDESSEEEEDPVDIQARKIMAEAQRPTDPYKGVEYDVVKIMRGLGENAENESKLIYHRVTGFANYIATLNTKIRELREEKAKAPKPESAKLQASINKKYDLLRAALEAAIQYGDEQALKNMGTYLKLMSSLTSVLTRQFSLKNYATALPMTLLQFFSLTTFMSVETMQRVKLEGLLESNVAYLNEQGKNYVAIIIANAKANVPKKPSEKPSSNPPAKPKPSEAVKDSRPIPTAKVASSPSKVTTTQARPQIAATSTTDTSRKETKNYSGLISARKATSTIAKPSAAALATKRPRDDDAEPRVAKKVAVESESGSPKSGKIAPAPNGQTAPTSGNGATRPRPSGTSVLSKPRTAVKPPIKKVEKIDTPSAISSTISGLLAEIARPAEKPKRQEEQPVRAPETPEEKARRLRKESRKGRTVRWKSDDELEQIKYFERDSAEDEEGRAGNMIRDARDNRLEGQMLKQMQRNMHDGDDEDDEGNPEETAVRPWVTPIATDFSGLPDKQREKNYLNRGGMRSIDSEQKQIMDSHENRELMSIYTTYSEIPPTPKSPPQVATSATFLEPPSFSKPAFEMGSGLPPDNDPRSIEIRRRWAERDQYGPMMATQYALQRLHMTSNRMNSSPVPLQPMTQEEREARVYKLLASVRMRDYVDPNTQPSNPNLTPPESDDPKVQRAWRTLTALVEEVKLDMARPDEAPMWLQRSDPARAMEWVAGKNADAATARKARLKEEAAQREAAEKEALRSQANNNLMPDQIATILQQVQDLSGPVAAPQPALPQPEYNMQNSFAAGAQPTQASVPTQDYNAAWHVWAQSQVQAYGAMAYQAPEQNAYQQQERSQAQAQGYGHHQYDNANVDEQSSRAQGSQQARDNNDRSNRKEFHRGPNKEFKDFNKGINRALIGTKPCSFWAKGQCAKGDKCTFRHDPADLK